MSLFTLLWGNKADLAMSFSGSTQPPHFLGHLVKGMSPPITTFLCPQLPQGMAPRTFD